MTEQDYVELIKGRWPSSGGAEPTPTTIAICDQGISDFPASSTLWLMRGDLLQLANYTGAPSISEAERSYRQAIATNPSCAAPYEELAHFLEVVMAKPRKAKPRKAKQYFRKAWLLRKSMA